MAQRVVITGLGPVSAAGIGKEQFFQTIWAGKNLAQQLPEAFRQKHAFRTNWYVPLPPQVNFADHGIELAEEAMLQAGDRMLIVAAKLALADAQIHVARDMRVADVAPVGVSIGTGLTGMQAALESYLAHSVPSKVLESALDRRVLFSRMVVPRTMTNASAAWLSICFGLTGACNTLNASCGSGTYAIGEAFRRIRNGYDQLVLAGGVECLAEPSGFMMRGFDVLGVLTRAPDGWPQPFSTKRSGFLFAEGGACVLVLEGLEHALQRGASIYAELTDYRCNSDANNIVQMDPAGTQVMRLLRELAQAGKIDYLNAHGTATVVNDEIEARCIRTVFGGVDTQPWINSTKGILGHSLGVSGAFEAAVTALSMARGTVHGNIADDPMPDLKLARKPTALDLTRAASVSYGFGGHNGGLLFQRYES